MDEQDTIAELIAELKDGDPNVRSAAARALGGTGNRSATRALIELLGTDLDANVRSYAAESLGRNGLAIAVPVLTLARKDSDKGVRSVAAWALDRLGSAVPAEPAE